VEDAKPNSISDALVLAEPPNQESDVGYLIQVVEGIYSSFFQDGLKKRNRSCVYDDLYVRYVGFHVVRFLDDVLTMLMLRSWFLTNSRIHSM